jgi:hypothetical protein
MINDIIYIIIGAFIGWNFPQPQVAKDFQAKYIVPAMLWVKSKIPFIG